MNRFHFIGNWQGHMWRWVAADLSSIERYADGYILKAPATGTHYCTELIVFFATPDGEVKFEELENISNLQALLDPDYHRDIGGETSLDSVEEMRAELIKTYSAEGSSYEERRDDERAYSDRIEAMTDEQVKRHYKEVFS